MRKSVSTILLIFGVVLAFSLSLMAEKPAKTTTEKTIKQSQIARGKMPLSKRLETIPENGGESPEGPAGAAADEFFKRAFPDNDIPLSRQKNALSASNNIKAKGFPKGKGRKGTWVTVGPSNAIYPFFEFRNIFVYVPNEYAAGGRTTTVLIAPTCTHQSCRLWIGTAGGGVWRTDKALAGTPSWTYLSSPFDMNTTGILAQDPNDPSGNTIYVGTGEFNACGSGCAAGVGIYKTTDGGNTWTGPLGNPEFAGRGVSTIAVQPGNPNVIYAGSGRAIAGVSSVCCNGAVSLIPGAAKWGLYKSTNGGASWTFIHNGSANVASCTGDTVEAGNGTPCSPRGVRSIAIDPANVQTIYAGSFARGVWRSNDGGATWTQIKPSLNSADTTMRPHLAVTLLPNGDTRMYVGEGASGAPASRLFRSDNVRTGAPVFATLTSSTITDPGYGSFNYCGGQCWYDNNVYTPPGHPDIVYLSGSNQYGETGVGFANGRAVVLSTDAGVSWSDMTYDATDVVHPNGLHPDHHGIATNPNNPFQFFEVGDGGVVRSSGQFADVSSHCALRGLTGALLTGCEMLLNRVPTKLESMNKGLSTLQFQSLSVSPHNDQLLQGGTQDNGTWQSTGNPVKWIETMIGDGGQSGFDAALPNVRFHSFTGTSIDINYFNGDVGEWNFIGQGFPGPAEGAAFYPPIISDPIVSKTIFAGRESVFRTKTHGMGTHSLEEYRSSCNEWTGNLAFTCGDWARLGPVKLTDATLGDRATGVVAAIERAPSNTSTLWAATSTGRVFVTQNADADPASAVSFVRIDSLSAVDPGRFVTGIYIDPANPNHAWISYSGFSASTPTTPGHVFDVLYDPSAGTATWTSIDGNLGDIPVDDIVFDNITGDVYIATDFGVFLDEGGGINEWLVAAPGLPNVEVAGLTIVPGGRKLYAATHGLSAWRLNLP